MDAKIVRGRNSTESGIPHDAVLGSIDVLLQRSMQNERQISEWGVRALKDPFSMPKLPLSAFYKHTYRLLSDFVRLLNLRTRLVRLNHIKGVYAIKYAILNP